MPKRAIPNPNPASPNPASRASGAPQDRSGACSSSGGASRCKVVVPATYDEAIEYLLSRVNVEKTLAGRVNPDAFKFGRTQALMEALGNPQNAFRSVHVAGSKGKGSVCEMTASALEACGLTVGLYTSPHLVDIRERVRINQRLISEYDMADVVSRVALAAPVVAKTWGEPTFFELMTAAAFLYFAEQAIDIAVVEVGLGGRLDCTNVLTPEVCIITALQLEHTQLLGNTLDKIAMEKAGIIKDGVPVVTFDKQGKEAMDVLRAIALERNAPLRVVGGEIDFSYRYETSAELGPHLRICVGTARGAFEHIPVPLKGEHQAFNCGMVLAAIDALRERGMDLKDRDIAAGLARTPNQGRLEIVHEAPRIVVDGAHNPESIAALMKSVGSHLNPGSMVVVFGCAADKNIPEMLAKLAMGADKVIFTKASDSARAADPRELHRRFVEISTSKMAQTAPTVKDAINLAALAVTQGDLICVTGSFYVAGEAKRLFMEKKREKDRMAAEIASRGEAKPTGDRAAGAGTPRKPIG